MQTRKLVLLAALAAPLLLADGSPGPLANSCGVPANPPSPGRGRGTPTFPPGQYPVQLPAVSMLGAHNDLPNPYRDGVDWGNLPAGRHWGSTASIFTAPDGNLWVVDRCGISGAGGTTCAGPNAGVDPVFEFDTSGKLIKSFGAGLFVSPHKITVDKQGNLWVADNGGHQVFKLDQNGKVLLTLGKKGVAGPGLDEFDQPTEVAIAPNGDIFVGDGHDGGGTALGNARIMKFDRNGKFLKTWGKKGMGPGEFDVIHTVAFDSRGRLFVGDRQNDRIQIFDQDGKFIAQWFQFGRPSGMYIDQRTDTIYVADSESRDGRTNTGVFALPQTGYGYNLGIRRGIRIGSAKDGTVKAFIPDPCPYPYAGVSTLAEGVTVDKEGNVYGADFLGNVRKFVKK
ncbi:MAG TPA: peptidyl-alpha-hydroxyglycine alpha-amidating lyase family protein [Bryobacteraceae bacterium]|nr:peptidyl-alpha-hydroxyglycine alpha-amidating lyase family protein [Bryobacteraceae bacterium]